MKKLFLILVCSILMTIFIAFNYLLLDREKNNKNIENLKYNNESQSVSIDVLGNEIKNSKDRISELNRKISELEQNNLNLQNQVQDLQNNLLLKEAELTERSQLVDKIKKELDQKPFISLIKKYVESLDNGDFKAAYELYSKDANGKEIQLNEYNSILEAIKSMKINSVKMKSDSEDGKDSGQISFEVSLDVKLKENAKSISYNEGENERLFTFGYNKLPDQWVIISISSPY